MQNWITGLMPAAIASVRHIGQPSHFPGLRNMVRLPFGFESLCGIPIPGLKNIVRLPYSQERIEYLGDAKAPRYKLGFDDWEVVETPGHTEDSLSFYNEATAELICGDLILNIGCEGYGILNQFHWNREVIIKTYEMLCDTIAPKVIYPGHGEAIRSDSNALRKVDTFKVRGSGRLR